MSCVAALYNEQIVWRSWMDGKEGLRFCWFRKQQGHDLYIVYSHLSAFTYQLKMEESTFLQTTRRIWPTALTGTFHTSVPRQTTVPYRLKPKKQQNKYKYTCINIWITVFTYWVSANNSNKYIILLYFKIMFISIFLTFFNVIQLFYNSFKFTL